MLLSFSWQTLLFGEEEFEFLLEVPLRATLMFIVTLVTLRVIGKRGIMQGVFEIVTIITLGSAAGDPMFYKKVGLLPAILVFIIVILMYKLINYIMSKSKHFEHLIEGKHMKLISNGQFEINNFSEYQLGKDEFFSDLRLKNITQLGQVRSAYVEASGRISVFYFPDNEVRTGLPIFPENLEKPLHRIEEKGMYSCIVCGHTLELESHSSQSCPVCNKNKWTKASNEKRIA